MKTSKIKISALELVDAWLFLGKNRRIKTDLVSPHFHSMEESGGVVARVPDSGAGSPGFDTQLRHHLFFCVLQQDTSPYLLLSAQE